jgi:cytoskeletal protein CcmA (bactofilin family)
MIFTRKNSGTGSQDIDTVIGPATRLEGNLNLQGNIRVDGSIRGDIAAEEAVVIIGGQGTVEGNITAKYVFLAGKVKGNITASGSLEISSSAEVEGDLKYTRISIEEGATVQGKFFKLTAAPRQANPTPKTTA